ncbi:MAG TPA: DUF6428 family protein [Verrucomicrobiae bacterium]|jgi:hypothetical protein|nr:DUF6428 family protein [Verrucomicrobiae bacterium]
MKLSEFKRILADNPQRNVRFFLPTGSKIPPHAHVTEIALIEKKFIDCGGQFRTESTCRLQAWFADDTDHRLTAGKLLGVLNKAGSFLTNDELEVDVEYEAPFVSQFPVESAEIKNEELAIQLGVKHTACLAEDRCLPPNLNKASRFAPIPEFKAGKCC